GSIPVVYAFGGLTLAQLYVVGFVTGTLTVAFDVSYQSYLPALVERDELEKARSFAKGRFVLQLESPQGLIMFGLRKEVLEQRAPDPEEVLAGVSAVTVEDVARVAQDVIADERLRLAVIGPFDDADRFEKLLN
ncbi:MAG TPA: hypothetical protein VLE97_09135, partial [Gaiellaceae bacterium]|nr:hypothetical protein [Gaiellaceae bacterium]